MKTYQFRVILKDVEELTEEIADALFAAGCDDGSPGSFSGVCAVDFDREADTLENAIRSAIANIQAAGFDADHVEIESEVFA